MNKINLKKYYIESLHAVLPEQYLVRNTKLIKLASAVLSCYVTKQQIPGKLQAQLSKSNLSKMAFSELCDFLKDKKELDKNGISYVRFIEQEVIGIACYYIETIEYFKPEEKFDIDEQLLSSLRLSNPKNILNTCCYNCGKVICRKDTDREFSQKNPHFCTKRENLDCFNTRQKLVQRNEFEWKCINRNCPHCEKSLTLSINMTKNSYHIGDFFCSDKGYMAYRKRIQRETYNNSSERSLSFLA